MFITACTKACHSSIYLTLGSLPPAQYPVTASYMKHYVHYRLHISLSLVHIWSTKFITAYTKACHSSKYVALRLLPPALKPVTCPYMNPYVHYCLHWSLSLAPLTAYLFQDLNVYLVPKFLPEI
jgi:hypothetical protein